MAVSIDQIAIAGFRATAATDELSNSIRVKLAFGNHAIPARLGIARSLSIASQPPEIAGETGRVIKGDTLFGTGADLAAWVSLIIEHAGRPLDSLREVQALVGAHWGRGLLLLAEELERSDGDPATFWRNLAQSALPEAEAGAGGRDLPAGPPSPGLLAIPIGSTAEDATSGVPALWPMNTGGSSPHAAIMGGVGSGKTRTAVAMARHIRSLVQVPMIAFDFKGDMSEGQNSLADAFNATVLTPPEQPVPLDIFALADRTAIGITKAAQRIRDSLSTLKGSRFGDLQKAMLGDAAESALRTQTPCTLVSLRDSLKGIYADRGRKEDGAISTLDDLCRLPFFRPEMSPGDFFSRSWIIRIPADMPDLVRVTIVTLVTDALDRYLNSLPDSATDTEGHRALRVLCVIDEAHRILGNKLPGLGGLIRLSRSKGGAVMLISQKPDDFAGEDDDFLSEMGLVAAFASNANPRAVSRILGTGANLATLKTGEVWAKLRGESSARRIVAWR